MGTPERKPHPADRVRELDPEPLAPGDAEAIAKARAAAERGEVMTTDELLAYLARCEAGLEPDDDDGD